MSARRFAFWVVALALLLLPLGRLTPPASSQPKKPDGALAVKDGRHISWQGWKFTWSIHPRNGLVLSLAFYGLLHGLSVSCQTQGDATLFGLSDLVRGCTCWVGPQRWHVSGSAGRALGESLWRAFLDHARGMYWSRVWALYVLVRWCQRHRVSI